MKKLVVLILTVSLLSACQMPWSDTVPAPANAEESSQPGFEKPVVEPAIEPDENESSDGMSGLGNLLIGDEIPQKSKNNPLVNWDQNHKSESWEKKPCLFDTSVECLYAQTSVSGSFDVSEFVVKMPFVVPEGWELVAGTFEGNLKLTNGFSQAHSGGYLMALSSNTSVSVLTLTDGFMVLVPAEIGRGEFCARLQQAVNHEWAHRWNYSDDAWGEDPCDGVDVVVPLDSDRIPN